MKLENAEKILEYIKTIEEIGRLDATGVFAIKISLDKLKNDTVQERDIEVIRLYKRGQLVVKE